MACATACVVRLDRLWDRVTGGPCKFGPHVKDSLTDLFCWDFLFFRWYFYRTSCGMGCMILWFSTAWAHFCSCFMTNGPLGGAIYYKLLEIVRFFSYIYCFRYCISELNKLITRANTWLGGTSDCHIPTTGSHLSRSELYTSAEHGPMCAVTPFTTCRLLSQQIPYHMDFSLPCHPNAFAPHCSLLRQCFPLVMCQVIHLSRRNPTWTS